LYTARSAEAVSIDKSFKFNPFDNRNAEIDPGITIVSDAFEAVTNGMDNPEAMMKLEQLQSGDEVEQWKNLIEAVNAFYAQDQRLLESCLENIPSDSLPGSLKPALLHMSGLSPLGRQPTFYEGKLIKKITEDSRFLTSAASQLNDNIEYGGDLFIETASLLIKEIKVNNTEASERLVLWCFNICFQQQFDEEPLADNVLMIFGQAEGLRLIALSLMEEDPESALICFTRSLIKRLIDRSIETNEAAGWLDIIDALMSACTPSDPVFIDMSELLSMLETELNIYFGLSGTKYLSSDPLEKLGSLKTRLSGSPSETEVPVLEQERPRIVEEAEDAPVLPLPVKAGNAVQLELF
jgi:hypothetical protein